MLKFLKILLLLFLLAITSCQKHDVENIVEDHNSEAYQKNEYGDSILIAVQELNDKGIQLREVADYKNALDTHFEALQLAEKYKDTLGIVFALNNIGTDLRRTSSNIEASKYHFKALELIEYKEELKKSKAVAMNGLGNIFLSLSKPDDAERYFKQSLFIEKFLKSSLGQAINYANVGEVKKMAGDYDQAMHYYQRSLKHNEMIDSDIGKAICKKSIGQLFLLKGKRQKGLKLMREAVSIMDESQDVFHVMEMEIALCEQLLKLEEYAEADTILTRIIDKVEIDQSYEHRFKAYDLLTDWSKSQNDFEQALLAKEKALLFRDSLTKQNNEVKILEIENRFKNEEALRKIVFLTQENRLVEKSRVNQLRIFILLFLLLTVLLGSSYILSRKRKQVNERLQEINNMKSRFFGNVSHEFRTPITLIQGPLEKMLKADIPDDLRRDAEMMHRNSRRLLLLVDQILSLSKIEAGKFEVKATKGDLSQFIARIAQLFEYRSVDNQFIYNVELEETGRVWFDPDIIEMIVSNLLSNAFKFTPKGGHITLIGRYDSKDNYRVSVSNTVYPDQVKDINKFFKRFYSNSKSHEGTGIGLALVKELTQLYRTNVEITKPEDKLIQFALSIPCAKNHFSFEELTVKKLREQDDLMRVVNDADNPDEVDQWGKPIMLIVEDDIDMRTFIKSLFMDVYHIEEAEDGAQGIEVAKTVIPDIIISDIMMPKTDGIKLANTLKNDPVTEHIPLILLTALTEEEMIVQGLVSQADDYITKPFVAKILEIKVQNLIRSRQKLKEKYRKEIIFEPLNTVVNDNAHSFTTILQGVLETHITDPSFGVKEFCDVAAMSRTQLHRKLNATTGMSTTEFIRVHRLKIASELLKNPETSVADACYLSGFNSASYFSKQFKNMFGVSPKDYKNNLKVQG